MQLTIAIFLLRHKLPVSEQGKVAARLSDFLVSDMSLAQACRWSRAGSLALLNFVWSRNIRDLNASTNYWSVAKLLHTEPHYYKWEFSQAMIQAVRRADLCMIQWLLSHFASCPIIKEVVEEVARRGQLGVLQLLDGDRTHGSIEMSFKSLNEAANQGHWDVVRWLHERPKATWEVKQRNTELVGAAVVQNNLEQVKWAIAVGYGVGELNFAGCSEAEWQIRTEIIRFLLDGAHGNVADIAGAAIIQAAKIGDLAFVRWLLSRPEAKMNGVRSVLGDAVTTSSRGGHLSVLEWLTTYMDAFDLPYERSKAMFEAAKYGNVELVEWLVVRYLRDPSVDLFCDQEQEMLADGPCASTAMDVAAQNGHMEVLQFLQAIDITSRKRRKTTQKATNFMYQVIRCTTTAMDAAASNGHLSIVKYLHKHRSEGCTVAALDGAAANGHLTVIKWLHKNRSEGCTAAAKNLAASNGHLKVVEFLHLNRCEGSTSSAMDHAATKPSTMCYPRTPPHIVYGKQLAILQWLHSRTSVDCTSAAMDAAAVNGDLVMLQWLHVNSQAGCTPNAMDAAAAFGRLDIVKWLHVNRWEGCTTAAMDNAAGNGHLDVVQWLYRNRSEGGTARALDEAAANGHLSIVQWLFFHCAGTRVTSALIRAMVSGHFEVVLFLHAHYPSSFDDERLNELKACLAANSRWNMACLEITEWFDDIYAATSDQSEQQLVETVD